MDAKGQQSGHLMLISPERVFYAGLLGRRANAPGRFNIYAAIGRIASQPPRASELRRNGVVPPYVPHSVEATSPVLSLVIEPETVEPGGYEELASASPGRRRPLRQRIRAAYETLREHQGGDGFTTTEFDRCALAKRCRSAGSIRACARDAADRKILPASR